MTKGATERILKTLENSGYDRTTLKPCPFCGGKAVIAWFGGSVAICSVCRAQGPGIWQSRAEAVFFWNERKEKTNDN